MCEFTLIIHKQEFTLQYINRLKRLVQEGGNIGREAAKMLNELQLSLAGVKIAERN